VFVPVNITDSLSLCFGFVLQDCVYGIAVGARAITCFVNSLCSPLHCSLVDLLARASFLCPGVSVFSLLAVMFVLLTSIVSLGTPCILAWLCCIGISWLLNTCAILYDIRSRLRNDHGRQLIYFKKYARFCLHSTLFAAGHIDFRSFSRKHADNFLCAVVDLGNDQRQHRRTR